MTEHEGFQPLPRSPLPDHPLDKELAKYVALTDYLLVLTKTMGESPLLQQARTHLTQGMDAVIKHVANAHRG